jgi:hypothetical protein
MSTPPVLVLDGGVLVLSGPAVVTVAAALRAAQVAAGRDGIRPSQSFTELRAVVDRAAAVVRAAGPGSTAVPQLPPPLDDECDHGEGMSTGKVAQLLGCKERNVRDLCARGRFVTARRLHGRWLIGSVEVSARLDARRHHGPGRSER